MADLRDVYGNSVQLTDEHGNPVQLTDEYGNPMHVTGIATTEHPPMHGGLNQMMEPQTRPASDSESQQQQQYRPSPPPPCYEVSNKEEIQPSAMSNISSVEDDGKKKGQEDKIKEKLTGGDHKEKEEESQTTAKAAVTTTRIATLPAQPQLEQEELYLREKIKAKLPW